MFSKPQQLRLLAVCFSLSQVTSGWSLNLREALEGKDVARGLLDGPVSEVGSVLIGTAGATSLESTPAATSTTAKSSKTQAPTTTTPTTSTTPETTAEVTSTTPTTAESTQAAPTSSETPETTPAATSDTPSATSSDAKVTTTAATPSASSVADVTVVMTTIDGQTSSYTTTPSNTATSSGSSKSTAAATLNQTSSSKSGMSTKTRNTVIGVVVGVGGTIVLCGLAVVAWRIWGRKKNTDESDGLMGYRSGVHSSGHEKSGSITGNTRNPFQSTLESYHNPAHGVNASSNF